MSTAKRKDLGRIFETAPPDKAVKDTTGKRQDREGKDATLFYLPKAAKKQLAYMAIEEERTQQDMLVEALNDFFKKYGKQPIA